ncbi:hypothetical protein [Marinobacter sp.]|uniref:hypothetical protein n=1 Tax=Marinobacter sp. TaxID=50741 RepID=UPI00384C6A54
MSNLHVKTVAPFDIEAIVNLVVRCQKGNSRNLISFDHLDDVLFGRHHCLKALVARKEMQIVGCLFYQMTFSIEQCCYDVKEVHCYILDREDAAEIRSALRERLAEQLEAAKPSRRRLGSVMGSEVSA